MRGNRFKDITDQSFGELTVIKLSDKKDRHGHILWECICTCGKTTYVAGSSLRAGNYKSCGCKRIKRRDAGLEEHIQSDAVDGTRKSALKAKKSSRNTSGHKGVNWMKNRGKWRAYIGYQGKQISLGYFDDINDAIEARKKAEKKYHKPHLGDDHFENK